jgi:exosortase
MAHGPALQSSSAGEADRDRSSEPRLPGVPIVDLVGLAAVAAAFTATFAPQLLWMWERWMRSEYYGHGLLIPPVAAYLICRRRETLVSLPKSRDGLGLVLVVAGVFLHLVALQLDVNFVSAFATIPVLLGLIAWIWGRVVLLAVLFPICYLAFAVPVDRLLIDAFSSPLQLTAAKMAATFGQVIGVPMSREGVNISVPEYSFEVAIACSGLKSLITMGALATLYAYLLQAATWQRVALVASSVPVALFANSVRVTLILLLARSMGERAAEGFFHSFSGAVVFMLGLGAIYGIGRLLRCRSLRSDI